MRRRDDDNTGSDGDESPVDEKDAHPDHRGFQGGGESPGCQAQWRLQPVLSGGFLHGLMRQDSGWVLKGGSNIYCRIPGARHIRDLDLYRQVDPTSSADAADALVRDIDSHTVGHYTFHVRRPDRRGRAGVIDSERVDVTVTHGVNNRLINFGIDFSGDLEVTGEAKTLTVPASYQVATEFLPPSFPVHSYPVASQLADKVCAMYERHGATPRGERRRATTISTTSP